MTCSNGFTCCLSDVIVVLLTCRQLMLVRQVFGDPRVLLLDSLVTQNRCHLTERKYLPIQRSLAASSSQILNSLKGLEMAARQVK